MNSCTEALKKVNMDALQRELSTRAPVLFTFLKAAGTPTKRHKPHLAMITMAAAVLLKAKDVHAANTGGEHSISRPCIKTGALQLTCSGCSLLKDASGIGKCNQCISGHVSNLY